jgi:hypothetical protein
MKLPDFIDAIQAKESDQDTGITRKEMAAIIALAVAAFLLRCYLVRFHDVISADGIGYYGAARALGAGDIGRLASYGFYPVLVWFAGLFIPDLEQAGQVVSMLLGSLLVVPLYLLGRSLYSRQTALAGCFLAAVWPTLLSWSCEVMTQATYVTLTITGFYLVWRMFRSPSAVVGGLAGFVLGLAYLTRTEAALLVLVMPIAAALVNCRGLRRMGTTLVSYLVAFTALFFLNILLVHHITGTWQLAAKTSVALNDALGFYLKIRDLNYVPGVKQTSYLEIMRQYPDFIRSNSLSNVRKALDTMLPAYLWILALIGFLSGGWCAERNAVRFFLLATFAPLLVIIVFYYVGPEYTQPYLPFLLLWVAEGFRQIERFLAGRFPALDFHKKGGRIRIPLALAVALLLSVSILIQQVPAQIDPASYIPTDDGGRRDHKRIGLLLKENLPPGKIMTRAARIAFYAEREWTNIPQASYAEILQTARLNKVSYLVVDGSLKGFRPQLGDLLAPLDPMGPGKIFFVNRAGKDIESMGMMLYLLYRDPSSMGVAVYRLSW